MKKVSGIWLPDADNHFAYMMTKEPATNYHGVPVGTYQRFKIDATLKLVRDWKCAIDVGAHVGFWSMWLAPKFTYVHAFEPVEQHAECFTMNVEAKNVTLHRVALGDVAGSVAMETQADNSGKAKVAGAGSIPMERLDDYGLDGVGLIKIDTEGYETKVLQGAADTIARCRPLIVVEVNSNADRYGELTPEDILPDMGYRLELGMGHDRIYRHADN